MCNYFVRISVKEKKYILRYVILIKTLISLNLELAGGGYAVMFCVMLLQVCDDTDIAVAASGNDYI
jgi:hypothetical protein